MSGSKRNTQLPVDSSTNMDNPYGTKGGGSASATTPGIQTHSGIGGPRKPESDYGLENGNKVYNKQDVDPATGDYSDTIRYVCGRRKAPGTGRSQYMLKDKPCNDLTGKWVSEWMDEGELEEV